MALKLNDTYVKQFIAQDELAGMSPQIGCGGTNAEDRLRSRQCFLGWLTFRLIMTGRNLYAFRKRLKN